MDEYELFLQKIKEQNYRQAFIYGQNIYSKIQNNDEYLNDYYDFIVNYVSVLIEIGDLNLSMQIIEQELAIIYIPFKYEKKFIEFRNLIRQLARGNENPKVNVEENEQIKKMIIEIQTIEDAVFIISKLSKLNTRLFLTEVKYILESPNYQDVVKSLFLLLIKEQEIIIKDLILFKDSQLQLIDTSILSQTNEVNSSLEIFKLIELELEKKPDFLIMASQVLQRYIVYVYPNDISEENYDNTAKAIINYVYYLNSLNITNGNVADIEKIAKAMIDGYS